MANVKFSPPDIVVPLTTMAISPKRKRHRYIWILDGLNINSVVLESLHPHPFWCKGKGGKVGSKVEADFISNPPYRYSVERPQQSNPHRDER